MPVRSLRMAGALTAALLSTAAFASAWPAPASVSVQLKIDQGCVRVDFEKSGFTEISPEFRAGYTRITVDGALQEALQYLDARLKSFGTVRAISLTPVNGGVLPADPIDAYSGTWVEAVQRFDEWCLANNRSDNPLISVVYPKFFSATAPGVEPASDSDVLQLRDTPLRLWPWDRTDDPTDPSGSTMRPQVGIVLCSLAPAYTADEWSRGKVAAAGDPGWCETIGPVLAAMHRRLHPVVGGSWWSGEVRDIVEDYLILSGYPPANPPGFATVRVAIDTDTRQITVHAPPRLALVKFTVPQVQREDALTYQRRARRLAQTGLYNLLPTPVFQKVHSAPDQWVVPGEAGVWWLKLEENPAKSAGAVVLLNTETLPAALPRLTQIGLALDGTFSPNEETRQLALSAAAADQPDLPRPIRPKLNSVTLRVTAQPGRPHDIDATYQRLRLAGDDALTISAGQHDTSILGGSYSRDYLGFPTLGRRLTLTGSYQEDSTADRQLAGQPASEQNKTGSLLASLEVWRDRNAAWLNANASVNYVHSDTAVANGPASGYRAVALNLGFDYRRGPPEGGIPYETAELASRIGELESTGGSYAWARVDLTRRGLLFGFVQLETRARAWVASASTPSAELPSLGGADSVRGFRRDSATGRALWSLQNEMWLPLRFDFGLPAKFAQIVRRKAHVAFFADLGGIDAPQNSAGDIHAGAGAGLRITHGIVTARLDWAHAVHSRTHLPGGSYWYFTLHVQPSF